ncbi:o-succinylbenzoate--CoA ligase [Photobacterium halotolerans]|uniref:O-succinylbenzoate--CoA ligase n=1 Tax=Photobacterium halotolerans TaxID=265726 RepID=A0A7X5AVU3_9GAMM|nr:o-succinylbenzoate--CoA ligase [Photobacterium halotolerans]NAW67280.1 o-succinylbenzoate--CoA ligase [Photobacterium halotolerans]
MNVDSLHQPCLWHTWACTRPDAIALVTPNNEYTWQALAEQIHHLARVLAAQGVSEGTVVTVVSNNSPDVVMLHLACIQLGAITALIVPQPYQLIQEKLRVLYGEGQRQFVWIRDSVISGFSEQDRQRLFTDCQILNLQAPAAASTPCLARDAEQHDAERLVSIVFTSGSSGVPKAVTHTQAQHLASARGLLAVFPFQQYDCWLLSLPLYHVSGLSILYRWLSAGACLKIGSGQLEQDIEGATHASLVATQLKRLLDHHQPLRLSHVLLGGSDVPMPLCQQARDNGIETWLGYGMTEAASTVTAKPTDDIASAGRVLPNRQVQLRNKRIYIAGDTLASGYYHQGQLIPLVDEQGWFDTKDVGQWIDGELRITGRADNQFISGGENIHCEEIEAVLNRHPDIRQSMVIPVHSPEYGARPIALIDSASDLSALQLPLWLEDKLTRFKIPDAFFSMPQQPQTGIKVSRKAMKEWFSDNQNEYQLMNDPENVK